MSDHRVYFGINLSRNHLQEIPEVASFQTGYFLMAPHLGYEHIFLDAAAFRFLEAGSLVSEVGYSYLGGDEGNLGSQRHHGEARVGWKQRFLSTRYPINLFVMPQVGSGLGGDKLNFGGGLPPEWGFGLTLQAQGTAGIEGCLTPSLCGTAGAGYFYERNIVGHSYDNRGVLFGLSIVTDPVKPAPEVQVEEKIVYQPETKIEEKEVDPSPGRALLVSVFLFPNQGWRIPTQPDYGPGGTILDERNHKLDAIAAQLKENTDIRIKLNGYANQTGDDKQNRVLSLRRALAVKDYLVKECGIDTQRIIVDGEFIYEGIGEDRRPVDASGTSVHGADERIFPDSGDPRNRCVKIEEIKEAKK